ncbi:hypothetical protein [Hydrogenimonas urashimensis]|uniref:hypothetical protein n=1 Tax=Hydrogenimonas urashimensis TaxID=2740515 RepID=UPI0019161164|nr:hypothetical protein [Hydrogenimonas urashimensis]
MNERKRYDFRMYLGNGESKILFFRALVVNEENYYFIEVPHFGIDEGAKEIFEGILHGTLEIEYFDTEEYKNPEIAPEIHVWRPHGETAIERLESAVDAPLSDVLPEMSIDQIELVEAFSFRFDGHDLNLAYGLSPKSAGNVFTLSNQYATTISSCNNGSFGETLQVEPIAASTKVPYLAEKIDETAIATIEKAIRDVKDGTIDRTYASQNDAYARLYKKFLKELKYLRTITDIRKFEFSSQNVSIGIDDFSVLNDIDMQLYNETVQGSGTVHHHERFLKSRPNIYVVVLDENDHETRLHLDSQRDNFKQMLRILKENDEKRIRYEGIQVSETVVEATHVYADA